MCVSLMITWRSGIRAACLRRSHRRTFCAITTRSRETRGLNNRQLQLIEYVRKHGRVTNRVYRELTGLSDEAARREIAGLLDLGILEHVGKGRSTAYVLKKRVGD